MESPLFSILNKSPEKSKVARPQPKVKVRGRATLDSGLWTRDSICVIAIALGWVVLQIIIPPQHEYPIIDDWIYARSVQHQVATGAFEMPAQSQASLVGLTLWGTLWVRRFGFS